MIKFTIARVVEGSDGSPAGYIVKCSDKNILRSMANRLGMDPAGVRLHRLDNGMYEMGISTFDMEHILFTFAGWGVRK